jgi:hypothetical protein
MRGIASGLEIRGVCTHKIREETVEFSLGQRSHVVPFAPMLYYDEVGL